MNPQTVPIVSILIGALVLLFGRRLFWLFVAAVGFWIGFELTPQLLHHPPEWLTLVVAIVLGVIGAVLAFVLQKVAIAIAGFIVGGHIATALMAAFVNTHAQYHGIAFVIGGIIGAILLLVLFDWALIFFSSIAGADLITSNLHVPPKGAAIIFIVLVIFGIFVQAAMFARRHRGLP
ncbi:MAG TPA: DUF4203 domain-containing protein [Chthoniobacterales bacterium]|jgi:hypothetical protein